MKNEFFVYKPVSKLWKIRDVDGNYDIGTYKQGSMEAHVIDMDGDGTEWTILQYGVVIAHGEVPPTPYVHDFYEGIRQVEDILVREGFLYCPDEKFEDPDKGEWPTPEDLS